jgi:hypothetical protein
MADAGHRNAVIVPAELEPIVRDLEDDDVVAHDGGGTGGTGGIIVNHCAFYTSLLISPLSVSVGHDIDVATRVHDHEGDDVEVRVSSDCGEVADPLQTADPGTGEADTTVRCDQVTQCEILIQVSDTGFVGCTGTDRGASSRTQIDCDPQ